MDQEGLLSSFGDSSNLESPIKPPKAAPPSKFGASSLRPPGPGRPPARLPGPPKPFGQPPRPTPAQLKPQPATDKSPEAFGETHMDQREATPSNDYSNVVSIPIESLKNDLLTAEELREQVISESIQEELNRSRSVVESSKNTQSQNGIPRTSEPMSQPQLPPQSKLLSCRHPFREHHES